ncbi:MAG: hypothetical protein RR630_05340 [Coprobacillus sp.]
MQRYMTVKYASLLLGLLTLFGIVHIMLISPFLNCLILDGDISQITQTISLFVIEPIICIFIMVIFINRQEEKLYDSIF